MCVLLIYIRETDADTAYTELLVTLNGTEAEFSMQCRAVAYHFLQKLWGCCQANLDCESEVNGKTAIYTLLSAGLPDRMLRIRLLFKAECVSEMSCYAAERLLFKLYSCSDILLDFRSSRSSFFRYHSFFLFFLEYSAEQLSLLQLNFLN